MPDDLTCPDCGADITVRTDALSLLDPSDATTEVEQTCPDCNWATTEDRDVSVTHAPAPDADTREKEPSND